jgi:hypothetical protein
MVPKDGSDVDNSFEILYLRHAIHSVHTKLPTDTDSFLLISVI